MMGSDGRRFKVGGSSGRRKENWFDNNNKNPCPTSRPHGLWEKRIFNCKHGRKAGSSQESQVSTIARKGWETFREQLEHGGDLDDEGLWILEGKVGGFQELRKYGGKKQESDTGGGAYGKGMQHTRWESWASREWRTEIKAVMMESGLGVEVRL